VGRSTPIYSIIITNLLVRLYVRQDTLVSIYGMGMAYLNPCIMGLPARINSGVSNLLAYCCCSCHWGETAAMALKSLSMSLHPYNNSLKHTDQFKSY
jgi:hypothetical protein